MKNTTLLLTAAAIAFTASLATLPQAQAKELSEKEIEKIVEKYILNNGDKIMQAVDNFQRKQRLDQAKEAQQKIKDSKDYLYDEKHPSVGPKDADVTIVEFFDYNCGYCKKAFDDIQKVVQEDKNVRFVFMEMPILGPSSFTAAQYSVAAQKQGKYFEYHTALMEHRGQKTPEELKKIGKKLGLDVDQLEKDAESDAVKDYITETSDFSRDLGVTGTPAFVAGDDLVRGYVGLDGLKKQIKDLRK